MKPKRSLYDWCIENNRQDILSEWAKDLNGVTPYDVAPSSLLIVYWRCKKGHIYTNNIANRTGRNQTCRQCYEIERIEKNNVAKRRPQLLDIWDKEGNLPKTPYNTTISQNIKIKWLCKVCGHRWESVLRDKETAGCPVCSGHTYKYGINDLETWCKKNNLNILKMYSVKNDKKPSEITFNNSKKVIWHCPKYNYDWVGSVNSVVSRSSKINCNICEKRNDVLNQNNISCGISLEKRKIKNFIDKNDRYKELSTWWSSDNNLNFLDVGYGVGEKKFIWKCPIGHKFKRTINWMYSDCSCPVCSKYSHVSFSELLLGYELKKCYNNLITSVNNNYFEWLGKMSLDIYIPKYKIAIEYDGPLHSNKIEIDNRKDDLCKQHNIRLIRVRFTSLNNTKSAYCIPIQKGTNEEVVNIAKIIVSLINTEYGEDKVLYTNLTVDEREVSKIFYNHLRENSLSSKYPEIVKEFDVVKNGGLNPEYIPYSSNINYWWKCEKCGSSWEQTPNARTQKGYAHKCPFCTNNRVKDGFNDIVTTHPNVVKEWDYNKNDKLPNEFVAGSHYKAWWVCKKCGHSWQTKITYRCLRNTKCPKCLYK